jgi:DNA-binding NarL/FixJ family response regulator
MKIFLVEDSDLIRERIRTMLTQITGIEICGEETRPNEALQGIAATLPDVVITDLQLDGGTGITVLEKMPQKTPEIISIVLTNYATPQFKQKCLKAGAKYFFDKTTEFLKIREAVENLLKTHPSTSQL